MIRERGSAAVELVLLTPALLALFLLVVAGGRLVQARGDIDAAARDGARAASIARSPSEARAAAEAVVAERLDRKVTCDPRVVDVDTSQFAAGGAVRVDVACEVDLADVALSGVPGSKRLEGHAVEVVDTYRGADRG